MINNFRLCGLDYVVSVKTSDEMEGRIGLVNHNTQEVWINKNFNTQTKKIALLHEIIHAMDHMFNLKMSEENVVYTTHAFYSLLKDNPNLINDILNLKDD